MADAAAFDLACFNVSTPAIVLAQSGAAAPTPAAPIPMPVLTLPPAVTIATPSPPSAFDYTADLELVQNTLVQYGDTWDSAQTIVNNLYAAGVQPGTVTASMAVSAMTGISSTAPAAVASSVVLSDPSTWPWYFWAGGAAVALFAFSGKQRG
jgi:hypothetical protein